MSPKTRTYLSMILLAGLTGCVDCLGCFGSSPPPIPPPAYGANAFGLVVASAGENPIVMAANEPLILEGLAISDALEPNTTYTVTLSKDDEVLLAVPVVSEDDGSLPRVVLLENIADYADLVAEGDLLIAEIVDAAQPLGGEILVGPIE